MGADFAPLDTRSRNKVLQALQQLGDFGGSEQEIISAFNRMQGLGQQSLQDYFGQAGASIGQQFEPQFAAGRNMLGSNPLLGDSGYANRLNRQLLTDLSSRLSGDYGQHAADMSNQNMGFLRSGYENRFNNRANLSGQAYEAMLGRPSKPSTGSQIAKGALSLGGAAIGAFTGNPMGAAQSLSGYDQAVQQGAPQMNYQPRPINVGGYQQPQGVYTPGMRQGPQPRYR